MSILKSIKLLLEGTITISFHVIWTCLCGSVMGFFVVMIYIPLSWLLTVNHKNAIKVNGGEINETDLTKPLTPSSPIVPTTPVQIAEPPSVSLGVLTPDTSVIEAKKDV